MKRLGFLQAYESDLGPTLLRGAALTPAGHEAAHELGVPKPQGPVHEFVEGLDTVQLAVLDAVTREQLRVPGGASERRPIRTRVLNALGAATNFDTINGAIDALTGTHLEVLGGSEPSYRVTLRGLLGSVWGTNALELIDGAFAFLGPWQRANPSSIRYSWSELRKSGDLPTTFLNLAEIAIRHARLATTFFHAEGDYWWRVPPDLDVRLKGDSSRDYVRRVIGTPDAVGKAEGSPTALASASSFGASPPANPRTDSPAASAPAPEAPQKSGPLERMNRARTAIFEHAGGRCPICNGLLAHKDEFDAERDAVTRTWTCSNQNPCPYRGQAFGIPIAEWQTSTQNEWYSKVAAQRASEAQIRCPTCGNETIEAEEAGVKTVGTSSHVWLSCKTPGCEFVRRKVTRSIRGTAISFVRYALLLVVVLAGAWLLKTVFGVGLVPGIHGATPSGTSPSAPLNSAAFPGDRTGSESLKTVVDGSGLPGVPGLQAKPPSDCGSLTEFTVATAHGVQRLHWADIRWIGQSGWLCGAIESFPGGRGPVGSGVLLTTTNNGGLWSPARFVGTGSGAFQWAPRANREARDAGGEARKYTWNDVGPVNAMLIFRPPDATTFYGWAAAMTGVYRSVDDGRSWRRSTPGPDHRDGYALYAGLADIEAGAEIYAVGWQGISHWSSEDSPQRNGWALQYPTYTREVTSIVATGGSEGRHVLATVPDRDGEEGRGSILELVPTTGLWEPVHLGLGVDPGERFLDITADENTAFVVGERGSMLRGTRRPGAAWSWVRLQPPASTSLVSVAHSGTEVWVVGSRGTILRSKDAGESWCTVRVSGLEDRAMNLRRVRLFGDTAWVVGDGFVGRYRL